MIYRIADYIALATIAAGSAYGIMLFCGCTPNQAMIAVFWSPVVIPFVSFMNANQECEGD